MFGYPIHSDSAAASYSGGSWVAALPLTNLQDRRIHKVTRSTNALAASTKFDINLGEAQYIRLAAIPWHNFSVNATIQIQGASDSGFSSVVYNSGALKAYPVIFPANQPLWDDPGTWDGYLAVDEYALGQRVYFAHVLTTITSARYWRVTILDTGNAAGYVELGRMIISSGYEPVINFMEGAQFGYEDPSTVSETDGGVRYHNVRSRRRRISFTLPIVDEGEGLVHLLDIQRRFGTTGQIFFVYDVDDTVHMHRRSFLATLRDLTSNTIHFASRSDHPFELVEEL